MVRTNWDIYTSQFSNSASTFFFFRILRFGSITVKKEKKSCTNLDRTSMDREAWGATVHGNAELDTTEQSTHAVSD